MNFLSGLVMWTIIPPMATSFLLSRYYGFKYSSPALRPKVGGKIYQRDYSVTKCLVLVGYFIYTMVNFVTSMKPTYYEKVGIHREDVPTELRSQFRKVMVNMHPDKNSSVDHDQFLAIKNIFDILNHEESLAAYDVFGPDVIAAVNYASAKSESRSSAQEYLFQALIEWAGFYIVTAIFLAFASASSTMRRIYWKAVSLLAFASLDMYVLMRPMEFCKAQNPSSSWYFPISIAIRYWNGLPTFAKLSILRHAYMSGGMAAGQIFSLFERKADQENFESAAKSIEGLVKGPLSRETQFLLESTMEPLRDNVEMQNLLKQDMGKTAVELQIYDSLDSGDRKRILQHKKNK